ncbi:MAG: rimI [Microbacteriaceae bacterium]|nr:rimI [Microbacteriaceae bacterium]
MTWELRRATPDDLADIMALEQSTFTTDAWSREAMLSDLRSPHTHYLVATTEAGAIEGYAGLFAPQGAQEGDIQTIAVAEHARGGGLGRALMNTLIAEARNRGSREVFLEVRADNPGAQHLYESLGFVAIATRPHYYQPDDVDAIVMRLVVPDPRLRPAVGA